MEINTVIKEKDWKTFDQSSPESEMPTWLKLTNGNIVLAAYGNNGMGATGWWKCSICYGNIYISKTTGYLTRGAMWQNAVLLIEAEP